MPISLHTPFETTDLLPLKSGDQVTISGIIYTARDTAHKKMTQLLEEGKELPLPIQGAVIYYAGPCPTPPGKIIGSVGPTTSGRMDSYTPAMIQAGLKGMIGKGKRSLEVQRACQEQKAVYFATIGGAAALMAGCVKSARVIAYPELGAEAIYELEVENLPAVVVDDCYGNDLYERQDQLSSPS